MTNIDDSDSFRVRMDANKNTIEERDGERRQPVLRSKRDFRKYLEDDEDKKTEEEEEVSPSLKRKGEGEEQKSKKPSTESILAQLDEENKPSSALENLASRQGVNTLEQRVDLSFDQESEGSASERRDSQPISIEQPQGLQTATQMLTPAQKAEKADQLKQIQEIANQIVDKVHTIRQEGKTDTILTLRYPPIFAGAQLRITAYDQARGEFNIAFSQLSYQAKALIDSAEIQQQLHRSLEQKGYVAHILIATTEKDDQAIIEMNANSFARNDEERENKEGEGQQKDRDETEEEQA
ncbi:MAG: hypothetical protein Tsb0021_12880 [Chlamydiales bacterium]